MNKTRFFLCIEKEEQWLNEMSGQGYNLVRKSGFSYEFMPAEEKGEYRYCVDIGKLSRNAEFVEFMESLDIKLISKNAMFYYYQVPKENSTDALYTDPQNRIFLYLKCMALLVLVGIMNLLILYDAKGPYLLNISIPFVVNLGMLCMVVYVIIKYIRNIVIIACKR